MKEYLLRDFEEWDELDCSVAFLDERFFSIQNSEDCVWDYHRTSNSIVPGLTEHFADYMIDIYNAAVTQMFCGKEYTVEDVFVINGTNRGTTEFNAETREEQYDGLGIAVYYFTDGGTFVRYYQSFFCDAVEMPFEEFVKPMHFYYWGNGMAGYGVTFEEFAKDPVKIDPSLAPFFGVAIENTPTKPVSPTILTHPMEYILPIAACVAVITVAIVAIVITVRKNKKQSPPTP